MAEIKATFRELGKGIRLPIGEPQVVTVLAVRRVRLVGLFFDLNKCFLLPSAIPGIRLIKSQYDQHPGSNLLVVGHTDTSGEDEPNLDLSLERAEAVAAYLTDHLEPWEAFFGETIPRNKRWGTREVQFMLSVLPETGPKFFSGEPSGQNNDETREAIKEFQAANDLKDDGIAGPKTRGVLIPRYMSLDGTSLPQEDGKKIAITTHGCGEGFPSVGTEDSVRNSDNRRVEIFFFDGGILPQPPSGRKSRRGSREYPQWLVQVGETLDFSDDASGGVSNIENGTVFMELFSEDGVTPLADRNYTLRALSGPSRDLNGSTDSQGRLRHENVEMGDYELSIEGTAEPCSALVLVQTIDEPQIRFLA